jgi:hypothetical protein
MSRFLLVLLQLLELLLKALDDGQELSLLGQEHGLEGHLLRLAGCCLLHPECFNRAHELLYLSLRVQKLGPLGPIAVFQAWHLC